MKEYQQKSETPNDTAKHFSTISSHQPIHCSHTKMSHIQPYATWGPYDEKIIQVNNDGSIDSDVHIATPSVWDYFSSFIPSPSYDKA